MFTTRLIKIAVTLLMISCGAPGSTPPPEAAAALAAEPVPPMTATAAPTAVAEVSAPSSPPPVKPAHVEEARFSNVEMTRCAQKLIEATEKVLQSPTFEANFKKHSTMLDMPKGQNIPVDEVFTSYFGLEAATGGPGPLPSILVSRAKDACAKPSVKSLTSGSVAVTDVFRCDNRAVTQVQEFVINRWYSKGNAAPSESKACAINTIAHELTHTVVAKAVGATTKADHRELYLDGDYKSLPHDQYLVSYATGTIAQCTYMQDSGLIDKTEADFAKCVKDAGTMEFTPSNNCKLFDGDKVGSAPCPELQ
jgi:hypothetical protein